MTTREEVIRAARRAMRSIVYENEKPAYMGINRGSWVYDVEDGSGRKYARVVQGDDFVPVACVLLDANIPDDYTQAVWVKFVREGQWAITRIRIEGY